MGATAVVSSSAAGVSSSLGSVSSTVTSLLSPVGTGIGGVVVAVALIYVLAHLDVISAAPETQESTRRTLVAAAIPLGLTFGGIVLFHTSQLL